MVNSYKNQFRFTWSCGTAAGRRTLHSTSNIWSPQSKKTPQNHNYHNLAADEEEDEADEVLPMYLCRKWLRLKTTPQPMAGSMLMKPSRFIWHSEGKTQPSMMTS